MAKSRKTFTGKENMWYNFMLDNGDFKEYSWGFLPDIHVYHC